MTRRLGQQSYPLTVGDEATKNRLYMRAIRRVALAFLFFGAFIGVTVAWVVAEIVQTVGGNQSE